MLHPSFRCPPASHTKSELAMRRMISLAAVLLLLSAAAPAPAADPIKHRLMFAEYGKGENRLVQLDADGKLVWEFKFPSIAGIFQPLAAGHLGFAYGANPTRRSQIS